MSLMRNNDIRKGTKLKPLGIKFENFKEVKLFLENFDFIDNGFLLRYKEMTFGSKRIQFINNELLDVRFI